MATAQRKITVVEGGEAAARAYWRENLRLILILLAIWAAVSLVAGVLLALPLSSVNLGQVPLSFWFAHQGSIVTFVILIFVYCALMDGLDRKYDLHE
jgi:putative solute:sodium symporter small subunit